MHQAFESPGLCLVSFRRRTNVSNVPSIVRSFAILRIIRSTSLWIVLADPIGFLYAAHQRFELPFGCSRSFVLNEAPLWNVRSIVLYVEHLSGTSSELSSGYSAYLCFERSFDRYSEHLSGSSEYRLSIFGAPLWVFRTFFAVIRRTSVSNVPFDRSVFCRFPC